MNKQQLASKIWESANKLRSKMEAYEYKDYILGFMFYKFLSDREVKYLKDNAWSEDMLDQVREDDTETLEYVQNNLGYFISYQNLFSTWINKGKDFQASDVTDAISAFNRLITPTYNDLFAGIFKTLETQLTKLGDTSGSRTKAIYELIRLINDIPMNGKHDYDVLGFVYEYLISNFAANAGKKAGEFYTPHEVSLLMSEIVAHHLQKKDHIKIYDPTSGSGSLLINIGQCAARYFEKEHAIHYYAQELKENTYNLTRMNLIMRGINPENIDTRNADTLEDDWPLNPSGGDCLRVDAVVSNPPYSQQWNPEGKENDPRYRFGLAPKNAADFAFLLHDLYHLNHDGIMTIVLPHGVLFRSGTERTIRKNLIEANHIDAIIGLPANIFFGTSIQTIIMVLKQNRSETDVLMIDASKEFGKSGKNNSLRICDIQKIVDVVLHRQTRPGFSELISQETIRENDYNLNIPRYIDVIENEERFDLFSLIHGGIPKEELDALSDDWQAFPSLKEILFSPKEDTNENYFLWNVDEPEQVVRTHETVIHFLKNYENNITQFMQFLENECFAKMMELDLVKEEKILREELFKHLETICLVDRYEAYQLLYDTWQIISGDLESIQQAGREVVHNFESLILPLNLVQETFLKEEMELSRSAKAKTALENKTKTMIATMTDDDVEKILQLKWFSALQKNLLDLASKKVDDLVITLESIKENYSSTLLDLQREISQTQNEFKNSLEGLQGDPFDEKALEALKLYLTKN